MVKCLPLYFRELVLASESSKEISYGAAWLLSVLVIGLMVKSHLMNESFYYYVTYIGYEYLKRKKTPSCHGL